MIRRPSPLAAAFLGACLASVLVAGCDAGTAGPTATPTQTTTQTPAATPTASSSVQPTATPSGSGAQTSPSATATDEWWNGPHVNTKLEDMLPDVLVGDVPLWKTSVTMANYLSGSSSGTKSVYTAWLVKLGKAPEDVDIAAATDLTEEWHIVILAIEIPNSTSVDLAAAFGAEAKSAGWPVAAKQIGTRSVLEIVDPKGDATNGRDIAYVYSKENVIFFVITDRVDLLATALLQLP